MTFDDGPDDVFTPQILDVLKDKGAKATFFVIDKRAEGYPKVMRRIAEEAHLIKKDGSKFVTVDELLMGE